MTVDYEIVRLIVTCNTVILYTRISNAYLFYVHVYVPTSMCMHHMHAVPLEPEEGMDSPRSEVTGIGKLWEVNPSPLQKHPEISTAELLSWLSVFSALNNGILGFF